MILRTLLFLAALYFVLFFLVKSFRSFFGQLNRQAPKPKVPKQKNKRELRFRKEDIVDADFEDISDDDSKE